MASTELQGVLENEIKKVVQQEIERLRVSIINELRNDLLSDTYLTRKEAQFYLKFKSVSFVGNLVKYGLPKYKLGSKTLLKKTDIDRFVTQHVAY